MNLPTIHLKNVLIWFMLLFYACAHKQKDDHPEYFEHFFVQLDTAAFSTHPVLLDSLDFAIQHFPAGAGDKGRYYSVKANHHIRKGEFKKALHFLDSMALVIDNRISEDRFREMKARQLTVKGQCYGALKNYDAGMSCLLQAKMLYPNIGCKGLQIDSRIGDMLYKQGRFSLAIEYYRLAFNTEQRCQPEKMQLAMNSQRYLDNIGLCYAEVGMLDSALFYYNATLNYISEHEQDYPANKRFIKLAQSVVYGNIAKVKALQNDFARAEEFNLASIKGTEKDYKDFTLATKLQLADVYVSWNKLDKAQLILHNLDSQYNFRQRGALEEKRMEWNLAMRRFWGKAGDHLKADAHTNEYLTIRDSLDLIVKKDISRDIGQEFENMEQRAINEKLEVANQETSFRLKIALLSGALAVLVIGFVWYNLWRSAKHVRKLEALNKQVQEKNEDLMQAFSSLEASQAENTRMTRMVAHDLKNPIGGIRTLTYSLRKREQDEEVQKILDLISATCASSLNLIDDLLKEKASLISMHKEMVDLRRLMEYCVDLLHTKSDEKNQELHLAEGETIYVPANREKMWRVISNLLSNAIKFSPEHSTIDIKLEKKPGTALLSVKDNGIGIPEDLRGKIFASDPDSSRTGTSGEESHGLGLSITQKIVAEHHGRIWFESEEHKGSTFYVELPINN